MKKFWRSFLLLAVLAAVSCVTINIYFPAEQVRGAASTAGQAAGSTRQHSQDSDSG